MGRQPLGTGACVCHNPVLFISPDLQVFSAHFSFAGSVCSPFLSLLPSPPHPHNFGDKFLPIHLCPVGGGAVVFHLFWSLCMCVRLVLEKRGQPYMWVLASAGRGWSSHLQCTDQSSWPSSSGVCLPSHVLLHWTFWVLGI